MGGGGYDSGSASDDDDEEEYEEVGGNRFLGFMFGNVDNSGDLDADYLDEDAKEHLAALADKLGSSLTEIDLSVKSHQASTDAAEQDYDAKAEDAVDYEDFDEQYEGPEIQAVNEEDYLLSKNDYILSESTLQPPTSDNEDYDEGVEEELEKEPVVSDKIIEIQAASLSVCFWLIYFGQQDVGVVSGVGVEKSSQDDVELGSMDSESSDAKSEDIHEKMGWRSYEYSIHEPLKKGKKRDHRYSIFKEKYTSMDVSDIVEADEEAFLKDSGQLFPSHLHLNQHDSSILSEDAGTVHGAIKTSAQIEEQRKNSYLSAEPMNEEMEWKSPVHSKFYPLDEHDWEERILWDNSPAISDNSVESFDLSGPDPGSSFIRESEQVTSPQNLHSELPVELNENFSNFLQNRSSVLLESFGSEDSSEPGNLPFSESRFHPQLLRLESQMQVDSPSHVDDRRIVQSFMKVMLLGVSPKLILDLQDKQMLFEILDHRDSKHLQHHSGAMIITRPLKQRVSHELLCHENQSGWQFNIANDKFYMNRKISQQLQSNSSKRTAYGIKIHHSAPAIKLQTMKLKLSNKDLANFHRPKALWYPHDHEVAVKERGKLPTVGPMKIILKSLGGKGNFKPSETVKVYYLGKELEDHMSLAAQNVQPNSLLHLVRTKIHLWPRAQKIPGENKSLRPPGAFKKKSDLSVKDGHIFLMEYCEERPLLLSNVGMGANLRTYYQKSSPGDQTGISLRNEKRSLGNVVILEQTDKSPFLGDIKAGCSQSSLETNMYKAPIFPHKVPPTDYLLVRSAKGKLCLRRIDRAAVIGQQEPLMEVLAPASKNLQAYIINRLLLYLYRDFQAAEKRGTLPWIRADELSAHFPNIPETIIRKKLKECAVLRFAQSISLNGMFNMQRDANGHLFWAKKRDFIIPSEEELKKMVLPENVCAYESMQAGLYRLKHLGITRLTLPASVSTATSQLPDEAIALAAASHIERELQITPWSLSSNFVACTTRMADTPEFSPFVLPCNDNLAISAGDRVNIERLEITGVGDPSGRGLGFSYVRAAPKAPMSNAIVKKKAGAGRGGSTVTGTDADLRRLSMEAAREFNVPDEQIAKQTRWHRIAMIRKLSSEQASCGVKVDPTTISKYARGQRMSFLQLQQQTREKCQEIWDRQVQSLSALDGDEIESDSEANSDLDSFAGDLENLLDAEEFEGDENNYESKNDKGDCVKGIKMRRRPSQAQAEEEFEDEAAEAAELCRLLMDDDEAEQKRKKKIKTGGVNAVLARTKPSFVDNVHWGKKMNKTQLSGSYMPKENSIRDSKEVETLTMKGKASEKVNTVKKNGTFNTPPLKTKLGHMKTNKNCPKYGKEPETPVETTDLEKASRKSTSQDLLNVSQHKLQKKRMITKSATKVEVSESEKSSLAKSLPVKFKCGSTEKFSDKPSDGAAADPSDQPTTSDVRTVSSDIDTGSRSTAKVNKIKIFNKAKPENIQVESHKPSIVIRRPPMDIERSQIESHKPSIVIRPPTYTDRDHVDPHKPSIVIRPPAEKDREKIQKKIVIKQSKETIDLDRVSQDGGTGREHRKTKKIVELSSFEKHGKAMQFSRESAKRKAKEDRRWWEEEEKRTAERLREEKERRMRSLEEQEKLADIKRYTETIKWDWDEEERQKAKKKKKMKKPKTSDDFSDDYRAARNGRRMPERDRGAKRRPVVDVGTYGAEYTPATKRRRVGEVGLANILEGIVDALKDRVEVSYLFMKPVPKKEAPDYLDIIKRPMDLSTIRDKVRKMEYKDRNEFRHDMWQIAYNAHVYNDRRNPGIPPLADQLLELCDYLLMEKQESLSEAEAGI
uniref:Transcription initiation factor TFIID subunit 1 n=1 Tax=Salix viminalis TaxID=40686 RepID=A0A6N2MFQ8_SALVM